MTTGFTQDATSGKWSIPKDPDAVLDYVENWAPWLDAIGDSLSAHSVTVTGAVLDSSIINGKTVVAWISGGQAGVNATVRFHITTAGGRQDDRTFTLKMKER